VDLQDVQAGSGGFAIRGAAVADGSGSSVSGAGDFNGDGLGDVTILSGLAVTRYPHFSRATYVVFGRPEWRVRTPTFRRGDCNDDGAVNISDVVATLGALFLGESDPGCEDACDSNDDGAVDISDPLNTLTVQFLGQGAIPPPGVKDCGIDPTVDEQTCETPTQNCPQ
jgi:hypothetical protein